MKVNLNPFLDGRIKFVIYDEDCVMFGKHYHTTMNKYLRCSCVYFLNMHNSNNDKMYSI